MPEKIFAGVDVGSMSTDLVLIDSQAQIVAAVVIPTGIHGARAAQEAFAQALDAASIDRDQVKTITATGYGRASVDFAERKITEITCHGLGAHHLFPRTGTVIDIGGQDSKVILVDDQGRMIDFTMNDKCAAGTGRFLEVMAQRLELGLTEFSKIVYVQGESLQISSTCTVFAESEVVSLLAKNTDRSRIVNGLQHAIVNRIWAMVRHLGVQGEVTLSGGVAYNAGLVSLLEEKLGAKMNIPDNPQIVGALGAALLARRALNP